MFNKLLQLFLVNILFFSTLLYSADGNDIGIIVSNASSVQEDGGTANFSVKLNEEPEWCEEVNVDYYTSNGSAKAGQDYNNSSGAVTFYGFCPDPFNLHAGSKNEIVHVNIINDDVYEKSQYFFLKITNSTVGYRVDDPSAYVWIYDNDSKPIQLNRFQNKSITESDTDKVLNMVVKFNQRIPSDITLTYHTQENSAVDGTDYIGVNTSIVVPALSNSAFLPITIKGNLTPETTKNFKVIIDSISEGTITTNNTATATIYDDDKIEVDVMCFDANEGASGESNNIKCKIFLANHKPYPVGEPDFNINYTSADGSATSAIAGTDYTPISGHVTFTTGDKEHIINIPTIGDDTIEPDKNVKLIISGSSYIIDTQSEAEIIDDDGEYAQMGFGSDMNTDDFYIVEGNSSQRNLNFTFTLDAPAVEGASFEYYTEDKDSNESNDYVPVSETYNIPTGDRNITISIKINGDKNIENDETFYLKIRNEHNLRVYGHTAKGHIINDDGSYPTLSCVNETESIIEGDSGQKTLTYLFLINKKLEETSSFEYHIEDDDDNEDDEDGDGDNDDDNDDDNEDIEGNDNDYEPIENTLYNLESNQTEVSISVTINSDSKIEKDEIFSLALFNPIHLKINENCQNIETTIINDDGDYPEASINAPQLSFNEGDADKTLVTFMIGLNTPAKENNITIEYQTIEGSANENDFDKIETSFATFNIGEQNQTFSTHINGDTKVENNETFFIKILNPYHATLSSNDEIEINIVNDDEASSDPFICDNSMYISSSTNRETSATGRMWLHRIDTTKNPFDFEVMEDIGASEIYNATAYNPDDNYIYGLYHRELIRLSKSAEVINLGTVNLPTRFENKQLYAGAISNGYYYVSGRNSKNRQLFKIKLSDLSVVTDINLSQEVAIQDFSFYKNVTEANSTNGVYLYGVDRRGKLTKIDVRDGTVTQIGSDHTGYEFDSSFSDKNGRFFANDGNGNGFFEFNLNTGVKTLISNSQFATFNDGANCINSALVFNDYGDAPNSYGVPKHNIANGIFLGTNVDHDITPLLGINANGDDTTGVDDEDGVTFLDGSDINGLYFDVNTTQELTVTASKDGYLNAWLDFGIDGSFSGDQIITAQALTKGTNKISFNIPATVTKDTLTYLRFRYSSTNILTATEDAIDGEVEDYAIHFGSAFKPLRGVFNIERTNSGSFAINTDERNAWYTQVVGRDFDYSIVFYEENMSAEKIISNLTSKVELVDTETNTTLYERYFHFPKNSTQSRFNISHSNHTAYEDDLSEQSQVSLPSIPASKDVHFRISYESDASGNIVQADCIGSTESNYKTCYNNLALTPQTHPAKDNFAIRPESYYIKLADHSVEKRDSKNSINSPLTLASGYDYNLTVVATKIDSIEPAKGYDYTIIRKLEFKGSPVCDNTTSPTQKVTFNNGLYNNINFTHDNVGNYAVILNDDHNWTYVDQIKGDCLSPNNFKVSANGNTLSGCDITPPNFDLNLSFYPYQFGLENVDFTVLPIDDNEFLYMDKDLDTVAVQLIGTLIAQNQSGDKTSNFTENCMATNVDLTLGVDYTSDTGFNTPLQTTLSPTGGAKLPVRLNRSFEFNRDGATMIERNITTIVTPITIGSGNFLEKNTSNRGSVFVDMRYNIAKNITRTINPVQIAFNTLDVNSKASQSHTEEINNFIPKGHKDLNQTRFFYFTQVVPDKPIYSRVNFPKNSPSIAVGTPLSVDIFCKNNLVPNFCEDMNILNNTLIHASPRKADGWYISTNHNHDFDGNITQLRSLNPISLTVSPNINVPFSNGQTSVISTVNDANHTNNVVTITLPSQLEYMEQNYTVPVTGNASGDWAGIGRAGNVLNTKANTRNSNKNDW